MSTQERRYIVDTGGDLKGPYSEGEVRRLLEEAELDRKAMVREASTEGEQGDWIAAAEKFPPITMLTIKDGEDRQHGPMPTNEVAAYVQDKKLKNPIYAKTEEEPRWVLAKRYVPELSAELSQEPKQFPFGLVAAGGIAVAAVVGLGLIAVAMAFLIF
ncbi:MAG: hypothetical protein RLY93_10335 [Sumerlaeia bacterium]